MEGYTCESRKRRNALQDATFVKFMQKYPNLANSTYRNRVMITDLWDDLTKLLNSCGPKRDAAQWRKVWADWKNYVRKKKLEKKLPLNSAEKAIYELSTSSKPEIRNTKLDEQASVTRTSVNTTVTSNDPIKPSSRSRSRSLTRSTSYTRSSISTSHGRSFSRSSSSSRTLTKTSSCRSRSVSSDSFKEDCSSTSRSSTASSERSIHSLSPAQSQFLEDLGNSSSLITAHVFETELSLPTEKSTQSTYEEKKYNLKEQFKKHSIALKTLSEVLNKSIRTQRETLKTARQMKGEMEVFNKTVNNLTQSINDKRAEKEIRNRQIELIHMKKNILKMELVSIRKRRKILRDM